MRILARSSHAIPAEDAYSKRLDVTYLVMVSLKATKHVVIILYNYVCMYTLAISNAESRRKLNNIISIHPDSPLYPR